MNNISMKVNFPLATTKDPVNLQIYRYTIDQLTAMEGDAIFLNTEEDETHLNIEAHEELLCLLEKDKRCLEYGYPSVKLFANGELINLPESSFGMVLKDTTVKLYINEKFYSEWTGIEPSLPACNMNDISIVVEGQLDYYIGLTESSIIKELDRIMEYEEQEIMNKNSLMDAQLSLTFPLATNNDRINLHIYRCIMTALINAVDADKMLMVHTYEDEAELYVSELDRFWCGIKEKDALKKSWYPTATVSVKGNRVNLPHDGSILFGIKTGTIKLLVDEGPFSHEKLILRKGAEEVKHNNDLIAPPSRMDNLTINVEGDLYYLDMEDLDRIFEL